MDAPARGTLAIAGKRLQPIARVGEGTYACVIVASLAEEASPSGSHTPRSASAAKRLCAIKIFKSKSNEVVNLAKREALALTRLHGHPNIVRLDGAYRSGGGRPILLLEYCPRDLSSELSRYPAGLPGRTLKLLAWQMLQALSSMHRLRYLHRDLKPSNMLLDEDGVLKLCDFGLAREMPQPAAQAQPAPRQENEPWVSGCDPRMTTYVVTRWYRAPEVLLAKPYGTPADIWSFGCTLAELATGEPLLPGTSTLDQMFQVWQMFGGVHQQKQQRAASAATAAGPRVRHAAAATSSRRAPSSASKNRHSSPSDSPCRKQGKQHTGQAGAPALVRVSPLRSRLGEQGDPGLGDVLEAALQTDPRDRPTADELLRMPYFDDVPRLIAGTVLGARYDAYLAIGGTATASVTNPAGSVTVIANVTAAGAGGSGSSKGAVQVGSRKAAVPRLFGARTAGESDNEAVDGATAAVSKPERVASLFARRSASATQEPPPVVRARSIGAVRGEAAAVRIAAAAATTGGLLPATLMAGNGSVAGRESVKSAGVRTNGCDPDQDRSNSGSSSRRVRCAVYPSDVLDPALLDSNDPRVISLHGGQHQPHLQQPLSTALGRPCRTQPHRAASETFSAVGSNKRSWAPVALRRGLAAAATAAAGGGAWAPQAPPPAPPGAPPTSSGYDVNSCSGFVRLGSRFDPLSRTMTPATLGRAAGCGSGGGGMPGSGVIPMATVVSSRRRRTRDSSFVQRVIGFVSGSGAAGVTGGSVEDRPPTGPRRASMYAISVPAGSNGGGCLSPSNPVPEAPAATSTVGSPLMDQRRSHAPCDNRDGEETGTLDLGWSSGAWKSTLRSAFASVDTRTGGMEAVLDLDGAEKCGRKGLERQGSLSKARRSCDTGVARAALAAAPRSGDSEELNVGVMGGCFPMLCTKRWGAETGRRTAESAERGFARKALLRLRGALTCSS